MAVTALSRLAAAAPVPVFAAVGPGMSAPVDDLSISPGINLIASIRRATLLLVAGTPRSNDLAALERLHDQMPHPRATVWWRAAPAAGFGDRGVVASEEDPVAALVETHQALISGERESEADILPDEPPNEWRGVGPHGQGGEGMMGGTPYGRPMPMMGEENRDGLMLDAYAGCFGPFLPALPPGLALEITLQGDVIQKASVRRPPYVDGPVERSDALRLAARMLDLLGLTPHAAGLRRVARNGGDLGGGRRVLRLIRLSQAIRAIPPRLGALPEGSACDAAGGRDVRARVARWLNGDVTNSPPPGDPGLRLVDLLAGLEWSEAMLVINSFDPQLLASMCPVEPEEESEAESEGDHDGHRKGDGRHHGSHGGGDS